MMRYGKPLGTLDWKTEKIYLLSSDEKVITDDIRKKILESMKNNETIIKNTKE